MPSMMLRLTVQPCLATSSETRSACCARPYRRFRLQPSTRVVSPNTYTEPLSPGDPIQAILAGRPTSASVHPRRRYRPVQDALPLGSEAGDVDDDADGLMRRRRLGDQPLARIVQRCRGGVQL